MSGEEHSAADCDRALDNLYLFLDHELDEASWDEVHAHIADCAPCLTAFDLERMVKHLVARSCTERAPELLRQRVMLTIRTVQVDTVRIDIVQDDRE